MKVLVVDDHEIVWHGMRALLERLLPQIHPARQLSLTGCPNVPAAEQLVERGFDLVLLDFHFQPPQPTGYDALGRMLRAFEACPVIVLSGEADPRRIRQVIEMGAAAYIPKTTAERDMQAALLHVLAHGVYLPPVALLDAPGPAGAEDEALSNDTIGAFVAAELSPRQRQVFALALRGVPNKVIARQLGIAEGTVKVHLAMVYRALGVRNRTEAMYRMLSADAAGSIERL